MQSAHLNTEITKLASLATPRTDLWECCTAEQQLFFLRQMEKLPPGLLAFLTPYSLEDYASKKARLYLSPSGDGGFALTNEGELLSMFCLGTGDGYKLLIDAVRMGARTLECFDGFLPRFYGQFGFKEAGRIPWDPAIAPAYWEYHKYGTPDLVYMSRSLDD